MIGRTQLHPTGRHQTAFRHCFYYIITINPTTYFAGAVGDDRRQNTADIDEDLPEDEEEMGEVLTMTKRGFGFIQRHNKPGAKQLFFHLDDVDPDSDRVRYG